MTDEHEYNTEESDESDCPKTGPLGISPDIIYVGLVWTYDLPIEPSENADEFALIYAIQNGTPIEAKYAFEELYRRYAPHMMGFLYRRGVNLDSRHDISARVWMKAITALATFEKRADAKTDKPFKSWLMSTTRFMMLEYFRAREKEQQLFLALTPQQIADFVEKRVDGEADIELNPFEQQKLEQIIDAAINELKFELDRAVIRLAFFEYPPCDAPEIARRLDMTPAAVRKRKSRALQRLKPLLEKHLRSSKQ